MNNRSLYETSLPTEALDALRERHEIETVGMLRATMKGEPNIMTRFFLEFALDYDDVMTELDRVTTQGDKGHEQV